MDAMEIKNEKMMHKLMRQELRAERRNILMIHDSQCDVCWNDFEDILEIHHHLPISCGGRNDMGNLAVLCPNCHRALHLLLQEKADSKKFEAVLGQFGEYQQLMLVEQFKKSKWAKIDQIMEQHEYTVQVMKARERMEEREKNEREWMQF